MVFSKEGLRSLNVLWWRQLIVGIVLCKSMIRVRHLVSIPIKEHSATEKIIGRFRLFRQDAYSTRFVKAMLSSSEPMFGPQERQRPC